MRRSRPVGAGVRMRWFVRRLGFGRSDLRRPVDRVQRAVGMVLVAVFLALAVPLAFWAADRAYRAGVRAEAAAKAGRYPVVATVAQRPADTTASPGDQSPPTVWARWRAPDGTARAGEIPAWPSAGKDGTRRIWVDGKGNVVPQPPRHGQVITEAALTGCWAVVGVGSLLTIVYLVTRRECDRRRAASWDQAWERLDRRYAG
ncbi:MAG: hypothetical protein IRY90_20030 [Actinomadura rubrobrunea]|nr:hypothetical protein [Actinomadura rubrobrunea]